MKKTKFRIGPVRHSVTAFNSGVIAAGSALHYKQTSKPIPEIGRELAVEYVVNGSVRQQESRVRVSAELMRVVDQVQLWTDQYDRELQDVFAIQTEIATAIADALRVLYTEN